MMIKFQFAALLVLAVFYGAYFVKLFGQKKKGIQTSQLGKGRKQKKTVIIEKVLSVTSVAIIIMEIGSVVLNYSIFESEFLRWGGILAACSGTGIFIVAMCTMQDSWRAGIPSKDRTALVTKGIYKISRNPAFLGFDLVYVGIGLTFFNPLLAVVSIWAIVMMHFQILEEEKFLGKVFGEEYEEYRREVGRYLGRK